MVITMLIVDLVNTYEGIADYDYVNLDAIATYIEIILDYMSETIPPIDNKHDKMFETRFSQRWAAAELIESIQNHPRTDPLIVIEDFIIGLDMYIRDTDSKKMKKHFQIAQETANQIGLYFV